MGRDDVLGRNAILTLLYRSICAQNLATAVEDVKACPHRSVEDAERGVPKSSVSGDAPNARLTSSFVAVSLSLSRSVLPPVLG